MTLEEIIRKRLEEATAQVEQEQTKVEEIKPDLDVESIDESFTVTNKNGKVSTHFSEKDANTAAKKLSDSTGIPHSVVFNRKDTVKANESVTESKSFDLFEGQEDFSEEFKLKASTIFEAAVVERALQIEEAAEAKYEQRLEEATSDIEDNIDGFLSAVVQEWAEDNQVGIASQIKTKLTESLLDGLKTLCDSHSIVLEDENVDVLDEAVSQIAGLETSVKSLQEEIVALKAEKILESFKSKMTSTEFDRFVILTESIKFKNETEYEKKLNIVLDNFGNKHVAKTITESVTHTQKVITESAADNIGLYAKYLSSAK